MRGDSCSSAIRRCGCACTIWFETKEFSMALCKDPSLTFLNASGYNVVRLPRVGIGPMDILGKDATIERLGRVDQLWTSTQPLPTVNGPLDAANITGQKSSDMKLSIGLKILS